LQLPPDFDPKIVNPDVAYNDIYKMTVRTSYSWQLMEPTAGTKPAPRGDFMMWMDQEDNIYIYGGVSTSSLQWTTLRGQSARVLGSMNSGTGTTHPGPRASSAAWFDENTNKLMLYGGDNTGVILAEVWEYSLSSGIWTWVSGQSASNVDATPDVEQGVPSTTAFPGSVWNSAAAKDGNGVVW
jgi:hypothetical protein